MTNPLYRRLSTLEGRRPRINDPELMSWDEIRVRIMDLCRAIASQEHEPPERREEALAQVAEVELEIQEAARRRATDAYAAEIAAQALAWSQRKGRGAYVPVVMGREIDDLDRPNIMQRRQTLWDRPDIRALMQQVSQ